MKSILFLSLISLSATACIDQVDDDQVDTTATPRLAANGLLPSVMRGTTLDGAALTGATLDPYSQTANDRALMSYVIECALDSSQSLTTSTAPTTTYVGSYGLATSWTAGALSTADRHWVSACVLARLNATGTNVAISMRGPHAALATTSAEAADYGVQEAAFYGDIFSGSTTTRACADVDTLTRPAYGTLPLRVCGRATGPKLASTACGFVYDGACSATCTTGANGYTSCTDKAGTTWHEVIKVNVLGN
jgi:hypothetical protein